MSGEAQLEALLEIINTSARQAFAEYKKGGNEVPTIHSKTYHPLDLDNDNVALRKAVRLLEGACQQLCASLAPPQHTIHNISIPFDWACVRVAACAKVADVLEKYPDGLHVAELAKVVNLDKGKLARVLRMLAIKGCFTEVQPNTFANNRIALVTLSSCDTSALFHSWTNAVTQGAASLYDTMTHPDYATSCHPDMSPLMYVLKKRGLKSYFALLEEDPEQRDSFHRAMIGMNLVSGCLSVLHHYPWNDVKTVCDVGAGLGASSRPLAKMYPHLKITDQDLPDILVKAKEAWSKEAPEALEDNQVDFVPLNFLQEIPVAGQDVYYIRNVIHDWPDMEAVTIMTNIRKAMAPHSRLLVHGWNLPLASEDATAKSLGLDIAPKPMLPNFGCGNNRMYQLDLIMWLMFNSRERLLDEMVSLGAAAGLRLEKAYDLAELSVLDFRVAT